MKFKSKNPKKFYLKLIRIINITNRVLRKIKNIMIFSNFSIIMHKISAHNIRKIVQFTVNLSFKIKIIIKLAINYIKCVLITKISILLHKMIQIYNKRIYLKKRKILISISIKNHKK